MDEFQNLLAKCLDSGKEVGLICDGWHVLLFCRVVFLFLTLFLFVCLVVCFFDHVIFVCLGQWSVSFVSKDPVGVCHFSLLESS